MWVEIHPEINDRVVIDTTENTVRGLWGKRGTVVGSWRDQIIVELDEPYLDEKRVSPRHLKFEDGEIVMEVAVQAAKARTA